MAAVGASASGDSPECTPLPSWLAEHLKIEWNSDDIDALLTSIDASQRAETPAFPHLPAELLLHILTYVSADYILDWRLVCRSFRDAIDGRILFHHLQRAQLIGYLGPRYSSPMRRLSDEAYEQLHLIHAEFASVERVQEESVSKPQSGPAWTGTHAIFNIDPRWRSMYDMQTSAWQYLPPVSRLLEQVLICRSDQGYGTLSWVLKLDAAVLDLVLPLEPGRHVIDASVDLSTWTVRIMWKPVLFEFFRMERALRLLTEQKRGSKFTFSHREDCLRAVRRQRLHTVLDPENKIDRHLKWSLRLLRPLWGIVGHRDPSTLDPVETDAVRVILLLRRTAALNQRQIQHLRELATDYKQMITTTNDLTRCVHDLADELILPDHRCTEYYDLSPGQMQSCMPPLNPITWSDELRADIENRVRKWRAQQQLIEQLQALMIASREALSVPEDAFDVIGSEF